MSIETQDPETDPLLDRWLWVLLPFALSILPFGNAIREAGTSFAGTGPDVVSSVWAMWWFQHEWLSGAWGAKSILFNFPWGGQGAILSPCSAAVWAVLDWIVGPALATTLTTWGMLAATMLGMIYLGITLRLNRVALGAMAMMVLAPRYIVFTLGETGVVGVAMLPMIVGLALVLQLEKQSDWTRWLFLMGMMGLQGVENPYLAPVLPLALMVQTIRLRQWHWLKLLMGGCCTMGAVVLLFRGASGDYESIRPSGYTQLFGLYFPAIERPWARADLFDLLSPKTVLWPAGSMDSIHIQGREYLGVSTFIIGLCGVLERRLWWWIVLAIGGLLLTTGSDWNGFPSVFGLLNSIADVVVRPFTQPSRYFVLYTVGMGICVGCVVNRCGRVGLVLLSVIGIDAMMWGGLSLRMPTTIVPDSECLSESFDAPVLVWPWDGADDQWFESSLKSRLFQLRHEQAGATIATGSWALEGTVFPGKRLRDIGWRKAMDRQGDLNTELLYEWGYRYAIVDKTAGRVLSKTARDDVFGVYNRIADCTEHAVYQLVKEP